MARREGAGGLAVDDVRGNRQDRLGRDGITVHGDLTNLVHDGVDHGRGDVVGTIIVIAVGREVAFGAVVDDKAGFVADRVDLRVLDRGQRVSDDGQTGDTATHGADDLGVVQSHFDGLVGVAVVTVMDDVESLNVGADDPVQHFLVALPHVVEVEGAIALNGFVAVHNLLAAHLVTTTVDGVEQSLGGVDAGTEELHLLADPHGGHAAGDGGIVAPVGANLRIGLVLDRGGLDGNASAEFLVTAGQVLVPEDRDVRLGRGAEVHQSLEQTERGLGH